MPTLHSSACYGKRPISNPFGVQVYGATGAKQNYFSLLKDSQSSWVRNSIIWPDVEPTNREPSEFHWTNADAAVQAAVDNCINVIITIDHTPDWATISFDRAPIETALLGEYVEFVTAVVERYDGDGIDDAPNRAAVNYWEFYNEPDLGAAIPGFEGWGEHGDLYAGMLKAVYGPVHEANPKAKVVFGGIAYNLFTDQDGQFVREFFDEVLEAGGGDYFDIMNFHYYPFQHNRAAWTTNDSSGLMEKAADIRTKMKAWGVDKPIMMTELGWHSDLFGDYPSSPEFQSRQVVQLLTQSMALGSVATIWWSLIDTCCAFPYKTGLVDFATPPNLKPAYPVYRELVNRLGTGKFVETIHGANSVNDLEVYKFATAGDIQFFYVAWLNPVIPFSSEAVASFDDSTAQPLQVPGSTATVYAKDGVLVETIHDAGDGVADGRVTVSVPRSPIYIVMAPQQPAAPGG
jgi:hypothetical protein